MSRPRYTRDYVPSECNVYPEYRLPAVPPHKSAPANRPTTSRQLHYLPDIWPHPAVRSSTNHLWNAHSSYRRPPHSKQNHPKATSAAPKSHSVARRRKTIPLGTNREKKRYRPNGYPLEPTPCGYPSRTPVYNPATPHSTHIRQSLCNHARLGRHRVTLFADKTPFSKPPFPFHTFPGK